MINNYLTISEITRQLHAVKAGEIFSWARIGLLILSVEHQRYWELNHKSLSAWLKYFSQDSGKSMSSCWRFMASAKYYSEISYHLSDDEFQCPDLINLSNSVSPENIEILSKLEPVLPEDFFVKLAKRVIKNEVTRVEIRDIWLTFRPSLQGKTKRGLKQKVIAEINIERKKEIEHEYNMIENLLVQRGKWLNLPEGFLCKQFKHFHINGTLNNLDSVFEVEVMIMTFSKILNQFNFHLVDYLVDINKDLLEKVVSISNKANYYWVIGHKANLLEKIEALPKEIGVIFSINDNKEFEIFRVAQFKEVDQTIFFKRVIAESVF